MKQIIDISEHNGNINFTKVKQAGVQGVIIRIGWIGNKQNHTIDKKFEEYYNQAKAEGLQIGFYVYSYCKSVEALRNGTNWVIDKIENKNFELPVFLDLEDSTIIECGKENLTQQAIQFCNIIKNIGYSSGVYANKDWFLNKLDINKLLNFKIWLAEWNNLDNPTLGYKVDLWQYTSDGKIDGINTRVDLNKCLCDCVGDNQNNVENNGGDEKLKVYQNGNTIEEVFCDTQLTKKIGSLDIKEKCECLGIYENRAIVRYKVNNTNNYKIGFVKWLGGVR